MNPDPRFAAAQQRTLDILAGRVERVRIVDVAGRGRVVLPDCPRGSLREDFEYWGTVDALDPDDCSEIAYALGNWEVVNQEAFVVYGDGHAMIYPGEDYQSFVSAQGNGIDYPRRVSLLAPE